MDKQSMIESLYMMEIAEQVLSGSINLNDNNFFKSMTKEQVKNYHSTVWDLLTNDNLWNKNNTQQ
jgi:hypothetical protein